MSTHAAIANSIDELIDEAARHLIIIARGGDDLTDEYRTVADILIDMREQMTTPDGSIDWGGRSYAYRTAVGEAYDKAQIFGEDRSRISANVRHHVSYMLHARLTPEELEAAGIGPASSRDRGRQTQEQRRAIFQAVRNNKVTGADPIQALTAATRLLQSVTEEQLDEVDERRIGRLIEAFAESHEAFTLLFDAIQTSRLAELAADAGLTERLREYRDALVKITETGVVERELTRPSRADRIREASRVRRDTRGGARPIER